MAHNEGVNIAKIEAVFLRYEKHFLVVLVVFFVLIVLLAAVVLFFKSDDGEPRVQERFSSLPVVEPLPWVKDVLTQPLPSHASKTPAKLSDIMSLGAPIVGFGAHMRKDWTIHGCLLQRASLLVRGVTV